MFRTYPTLICNNVSSQYRCEIGIVYIIKLYPGDILCGAGPLCVEGSEIGDKAVLGGVNTVTNINFKLIYYVRKRVPVMSKGLNGSIITPYSFPLVKVPRPLFIYFECAGFDVVTFQIRNLKEYIPGF